MPSQPNELSPTFEEPLPRYTTSGAASGGRSSSLPPPAYTFPISFKIGNKQTMNPLVTPVQLKTHLSLLNAFFALRRKVEELPQSAAPFSDFPKEKDKRLGWLVAFAVERFALWCQSLSTDVASQRPGDDILPPLDVIMIWHAYMLNPEWYAEDSLRIPEVGILSKLGEATSCPLLPTLSDTLNTPPSGKRTDTWNLLAGGRPFDILEDAAANQIKNITCPECGETIQHPYILPNGEGYLQQKFAARCPTCDANVTKSSLRARKFVVDIVRSGDSPRSYLAGTLRTSRLAADIRRAKAIKADITASTSFGRPKGCLNEGAWAYHIAKSHHFTMENLKDTLTAQLAPSQGLVNRIMSAYETEDIFSLDLVGAVLRQGVFVEKMHDLRWTEWAYFDGSEDELVLQHAIARYHAFLDLMSSVTGFFCVPTLDIDLAWHTHQLLGPRYSEDCQTYVGRHVDHDDKIEENTLVNAFDETSKAWQSRFCVPYTHCGCPSPGESIGQILHRLRSKFAPTPAAYLVPPQSSTYTQSILAGTHPSDHNSVFDFRDGSTRRIKREKKRSKTLAKQERKGRHNTTLRYGHDPAFLTPVPIWTFYPVCAGGPPPKANTTVHPRVEGIREAQQLLVVLAPELTTEGTQLIVVAEVGVAAAVAVVAVVEVAEDVAEDVIADESLVELSVEFE